MADRRRTRSFLLRWGVLVAGNGDIFAGDFKDVRVRRIRNGLISTVGTAQGEALALDSRGRLHATSGSSVLRIEPDGSSTRVAGTGVAGYSGDGSVANTARLQFAEGLAFDSTDTMYIAVSDHVRTCFSGQQPVIHSWQSGVSVEGSRSSHRAGIAAEVRQ